MAEQTRLPLTPPREPRPVRHYRRFPGKPFGYRPPKAIARELKVAHKEGRLLDIEAPAVPD